MSEEAIKRVKEGENGDRNLRQKILRGGDARS
jgi:hypothetical protein